MPVPLPRKSTARASASGKPSTTQRRVPTADRTTRHARRAPRSSGEDLGLTAGAVRARLESACGSKAYLLNTLWRRADVSVEGIS